jgi:hypothetical protein
VAVAVARSHPACCGRSSRDRAAACCPVLRLFDGERFKHAAVIGKIVDHPERVAVV